jgi:hypothetical protein
MVVGTSESNHTEGFRKYQPGQYVNAATGWSRDYWLPKSVVLSKRSPSFVVSEVLADPLTISVSSPVTLTYTINERSEEPWPSSPRTHSITPSTSSIHSVHSPHPTNPFLSISPQFSNPSLSHVNPFVHNAFSSITASLFDDEETSNVVFIISEPPPGTRPSEFYSKSTKNTLGLSRNGNGASTEDAARGTPGVVPGSGRNSRASRVRGAREEYIYAHTKVLGARSDYFRNSKSSPLIVPLCLTCNTQCLPTNPPSTRSSMPHRSKRILGRCQWVPARWEQRSPTKISTMGMRILPLQGRRPRESSPLQDPL